MLSNLIRWGGLAAMLAGALFVAADLLSLSISPKFPSSVSLSSEAYAIQSVLKLAGAALLLLGLTDLHARQAEDTGPLGTAGFLAAFSGTALVVGSFWATAFFAPAMAAMDPAGFDAGQGPPGRLADAFVVTMAAFILGWMLFGVSAWRARVYPRAAAPAEAFPELTAREREVLDLIAQGRNNPEIAKQLYLSQKTLRNHISNIFTKLQVADRSQAIIRAREAGLGHGEA